MKQQKNIQQLNSPKKQIREQISMSSSDWLIWLLALICVWTGLGTYGVLNNNEGLYAQIAHEMVHSGDVTYWIIPHLNGLPYMEKPPLLYWLTAFAFMLFGQAEWVVRLVPTLSSLVCVGVMLNFGRRIYRPEMGRFAALMFISGLGVMVISRSLLFDMLLTSFLTAALLSAYLFLVEDQQRDLRLAYICLAFAVLAKGFVAIILFKIVVLTWMIFVHRAFSWKHIKKWLDPVSIGLFFAITVPWLLAASLIEPIFPWFFFINEHVLRFLGLRIPHDYYSGSWWYYLPRMVLYLFPWSFLLPIALFSKRLTLSRVELQETTLLKNSLMMGWLVPLIFFSLSNAKANYYLIVVMPFAALHLSLLLEQRHFLSGKRSMAFGGVMTLLAAAAAIALHFLPNLDLPELVIMNLPIKNFLLITFWSAAGLSILTALAAWRFPKTGLLAYSALSLFLMAVLLVTTNAVDSSISDRSMAQFIQQTLPNRPVYLYRQYEQHSSLPFYLQKSLNVIDSSSNDLYWGNRVRPKNTIMMSYKQFEKEKGAAVVIVPDAYLDEFIYKNKRRKLNQRKQFHDVSVFY